jgi:hypothetical protein
VVGQNNSWLRHATRLPLASFEVGLPLRSFLRRIHLLHVPPPFHLTCTQSHALALALVRTLQINLLQQQQQLQHTTPATTLNSPIGRSHTRHILSLILVPPQPHIP